MKAKRWFVVSLMACLPAALGAGPGASGLGAEEAFDKLRTLAGDWSGARTGEGTAAEAEAVHDPGARHEFRLSAAGSVVMETMFPGTDHEMINMYHLDRDDLVLTHYCAAGNQPHMRLDRAASSADRLVFEFAGGTNLDASADMHIHSAQLTFAGGGLTSEWTSWDGGKPAETMTFHLVRD